MPNFRQDPDATILVRTFGVTFRPQKKMNLSPPNARGWDQLLHATQGMMTVHTDICAWAVPPHRAVLVPASLHCRIEMNGEVALRILYFRSGARAAKTCSVVNVTPLLRELIVRAISLGALDSTVPTHKRLYAILRDEIKTLHSIPLQLPHPKDERAARFAALAENSLPLRLRKCGASLRTLERLFHAETGMSLGQWLRREKLLKALRLLSAGKSVKQAALEIGYANPSAFIAMFRRELGATPAQYLRRDATASPAPPESIAR